MNSKRAVEEHLLGTFFCFLHEWEGLEGRREMGTPKWVSLHPKRCFLSGGKQITLASQTPVLPVRSLGTALKTAGADGETVPNDYE